MIQTLKRWWRRLVASLAPQKETTVSLEYNPSEKKRIAQGVRRFFEQNYELRYNIVKQTEEFRPKKAVAANCNSTARYCNSNASYCNSMQPYCTSMEDNPWQQLTDRELNRIVIEQMEQEGVAWAVDVELYVHSTLVPRYSPVADFLERCGTWDGQTDHIRRTARRVPTAYAAWPDRFHRWFLGMVAQWMNLSRDYGNAIVPLLIGGQGLHKSTFCKLLLPPELREYYVDDIKLDSAEQVERMLGRMLLVNIDEYNAKTGREQAKIKRVLTEKDVQTRRMRSDQYVMRPRMASFIATTNEPEPLTDPTGSRRYLCCEVTGLIDTESPTDYRQLYAQAVTELQAGEPYYFSKEEEAEIERHNSDYRCQSSPETVLLAYYKPANRHKEHFIRAVDIQAELRQHLRKADVPSITTLTKALKACHFPHGKFKGIRGWYAERT